MSLLLAAPEALVTAASDLAGIGSTISTANAVAAAPTTGVLAAAADEVSTQIATLFSEHALGYQQLSAQAATFHEQFVQALSASASTYTASEANTAQTLVNAVNAPAQAVLGHPLIGSAITTAGCGAAGGGVLSNAVSRVESLFVGNSGAARLLGGSGAAASDVGASALLLRPTGGIKALTAATPLLQAGSLTNAAAAPAAIVGGSIGNAIEDAYLAIEPWAACGFNLLSLPPIP
jgi:PE family